MFTNNSVEKVYIGQAVLYGHRYIQVLLDRFQVSLELLWASVIPGQGLKAAELLNKLGRAVGLGCFQLVNAEKGIMVQGGLPEIDFKISV